MLLLRIERYLRATRVPPSRFGRDAMGDPQFVFDLREGRVPGRRTKNRVTAYLDQVERVSPEQDAQPC